MNTTEIFLVAMLVIFTVPMVTPMLRRLASGSAAAAIPDVHDRAEA